MYNRCWKIEREGSDESVLYDEAKAVRDDIRKLCFNPEHPARIEARRIMDEINDILDPTRRSTMPAVKTGGGRNKGKHFGNAQNMLKKRQKTFVVSPELERRLMAALEMATKEPKYEGI